MPEELPIKLTEEEQAQMEAGLKKAAESLALGLWSTRTEEVTIRMNLTKRALMRHYEAVKTLRPDIDEVRMREGDDLRVSYYFSIGYFGDVVENLQAVQELCEAPDIVMEASCEELEQGRILVFEVLKKLEAIIAVKKKG